MATTTNFGWETPDDTDLVKDGAAAIRTSLNGVDSSFVDLKGGTTGQVLSKASGTDLDFTWVAQDDSNAIQNAIVDAKGDIIAASAADTPARLAVGSNGNVLIADSTASLGIRWGAVPAGKIIQVVNATYATEASTTSQTFSATGLAASITPTSASSTILVLVNQGNVGADGQYNSCSLKLRRDTTDISTFGLGVGYGDASSALRTTGSTSIAYVDSPASTSAISYNTQYARGHTQGTAYVQVFSSRSSITLIELGA